MVVGDLSSASPSPLPCVVVCSGVQCGGVWWSTVWWCVVECSVVVCSRVWRRRCKEEHSYSCSYLPDSSTIVCSCPNLTSPLDCLAIG